MAGLLAGVAGENGAPPSLRIRLMSENRDRARQTKFNEKELCRTTCRDRCSELSAIEPRERSRLGECASAHVVCCVASPNDCADGYSPNCALHPPDHSLSY